MTYNDRDFAVYFAGLSQMIGLDGEAAPMWHVTAIVPVGYEALCDGRQIIEVTSWWPWELTAHPANGDDEETEVPPGGAGGTSELCGPCLHRLSKVARWGTDPPIMLPRVNLWLPRGIGEPGHAPPPGYES